MLRRYRDGLLSRGHVPHREHFSIRFRSAKKQTGSEYQCSPFVPPGKPWGPGGCC